MPTSLYTILTFARINTKRFFRDKVSIFFGVLFPLIFLFIFGGIFGGDSGPNFHISLINQSSSPFAKQFVEKLQENSGFKLELTDKSLDDAREKMVRSQIDATVILPEDFGAVDANGVPTGQATVYYTQNGEQSGRALQAIFGGVFQDINRGITKADEPFGVKGEQLNVKSLTNLDYTFAGMLGTAFDLNVVGNMFILIPYLILSIMLLLGIGLAIGGWASNERQAAPLSNIVVFPMMFLSGTFFPRFLMPDWLQQISAFLPLTPIIDGLRYIVNEGYIVAQLAPQLGLMAAWIVVIYLIAFRVFRWE